MNIDSRLSKIERAMTSEQGCSCGAGPLVAWPENEDREPQTPTELERTCSQCGRARAVLMVSYGD